MPVIRKQRQATWFLEGFTEEGKTWIINLEPLPFVIGRQRGCHLRLSSSEISRRHAIIFVRDGMLGVKEFGSTNGTFVNHQRLVGERTLQNGDILHFGQVVIGLYIFVLEVLEPQLLPSVCLQKADEFIYFHDLFDFHLIS